jgi:hypothetical protein
MYSFRGIIIGAEASASYSGATRFALPDNSAPARPSELPASLADTDIPQHYTFPTGPASLRLEYTFKMQREHLINLILTRNMSVTINITSGMIYCISIHMTQ